MSQTLIVVLVILCVAPGWVLGSSPVPTGDSPIKADETVTFYTTAAWPVAEPGAWRASVHGIIFEPETRRVAAATLKQALRLDPDRLGIEARPLMEERLRYFLADNERDKALPVMIGDRTWRLPKSGPNGHFRGEISLALSSSEPLTVRAVLRDRDDRTFAGVILPMEDGPRPMVVSDIDDTIKITHVRDRRATLENTFARPFAEVPGMAALYEAWARHGSDFHYVSGSPWQLYTPLESFRSEKGFPAGAWHLRNLRMVDLETILAFIGSQHDHKLESIRGLLQRWSQRRFVLVGDTGEQDPEIYARLAREHPDRIARIFLRNITSEDPTNARLTTAFADVLPDTWRLFKTAEELPTKLDL